MNADMKESFSRIKPVCDVVMICPSPETISNFVTRVSGLKKEVVQELQQYLLFPFITHLKSTEMEKKYELQWRLVDGMRVVLEKVVVNSYEMCMKIETSLLQLVFDNSKPGMIADVPEELKYSVMKCLMVLMLNIDKRFREKLLKTQVPMLAQAVFVSVHIAKLEKMRALRLAAINCVTAHTATHARLTDKYRIPDPVLESQVVDMLASILPGVLAALQDVATCPNNPGHAVVVASIEAIHRILCLTMQDKFMTKRENVTAKEFTEMFSEIVHEQNEVSCKEKGKLKQVPKRSCEWYAMAGEKLTMITKSLIVLRTHEHFKVRRELAVFCSRVLNECTLTMQPSMPMVLDILISLCKDEYACVAEYCAAAVNGYFAAAPPHTRHRTMDNLSENLFVMLNGLPRVLNNIDTGRKLYALNLVHGYLQVLSDAARPQRLTLALSAHDNMRRLCLALQEAAAVRTDLTLLTQHTHTDLSAAGPMSSPWCRLRHVEAGACEARLQDVLGLLAAAECSELILDRLLQLFRQDRSPDLAYLMNHMAKAPNSPQSFVERVLDTYIEEDVWYMPLEVGSGEPPLTREDTLDVTVYNPRAWTKDSVPGLYEGAVETRYTDVGYSSPRRAAHSEPDKCGTLAEAQRNMALCCLLTEGVGLMARRLGDKFQPYLMKTLCLLLERVGSKYSWVQQAGRAGLAGAAAAHGGSEAALVAHNADYFTHQVTLRLKKSWNTESALQILSVVMEYCDESILDCLYGIVKDVLVQSCDKYYEKNLYAYLQVFLTFVNCIHKWFPVEDVTKPLEGKEEDQLDLTKDLLEYIESSEEAERLMSNEEFEKETGKSVEEMYREDMKSKEDDVLDYDDKVAEEKPPLPQHVSVCLSLLRRCVHFCSARREDAAAALSLLARGLPLLARHEDDLLPLVHLIWAPLVARFETSEPVVLRRALELLVVMANLSKDFIHSRCVKEVLPHIYQYLHKSSADSHLKDVGSWYRTSAAYEYQAAALAALASLAPDLGLRDEKLDQAMACVDHYLSSKQPKPLQAAAVNFYQAILNYDYGAAWYHLRTVCSNDLVLEPPQIEIISLKPVVGTPYEPANKDYETNIKLIFNHAIS